MAGILIYVAVPIDGVTADQRAMDLPWLRLRESLRHVLAATPGVVGYHPYHAFTVGADTEVSRGLERANRGALEAADGLLALVPAGVSSVGVPREIEAATVAGTPVAVLSDHTNSFALADQPMFEMTIPGVRAALKWLTQRAESASRVDPNAIYVDRMTEDGAIPVRAHGTDAGFDLYSSREVVVNPGKFVDVHTDLRVAIPPTMWGRIVGRSSTFRNRRLLVLEGVIDAGYRGPIFTGVTNLSDDPVTIARGERVAQFIPHYNVAAVTTLVEVGASAFDALPHDGRGARGFGSSGS